MPENTSEEAHVQIPFALPSIGDEEVAAVERVLRSGWLTTGTEATSFEREFAESLGVPHALAVNSATAGLHLALEACGVGPGDVVLVPSLTFTATAEVARYLGADVAFVDVDRSTLLVTAETVAAALDRARARAQRVSACIPVHFAGAVCDLASLSDLLKRHDVVMIEDAAHAFPATNGTSRAGTAGRAGVFSFYANKTMTTGEGGMVVTSDDGIAERIRRMRLHGIDREAWDRYRTPGAQWRYDVVAPGYKYNMPDIAAALGRVQLARAEAMRCARAKLAARYLDLLDPLAGAGVLQLPAADDGHAWHLFVVRLADSAAVDRDRIIAHLAAHGIGSSVHYLPLHRMRYWRERYPDAIGDVPVTESIAESLISLPLFTDMPLVAVDRVVEALRGALTEGVRS